MGHLDYYYYYIFLHNRILAFYGINVPLIAEAGRKSLAIDTKTIWGPFSQEMEELHTHFWAKTEML